LENIQKYLTTLTLVAVFFVAVFNIGYFYAIGYHFIGVMDLSNVVYSIGLVFFALAFLAFVSTQISIFDFSRVARSEKIYNGMIIIGIIAVMLFGLVIYFYHQSDEVGLLLSFSYLFFFTLMLGILIIFRRARTGVWLIPFIMAFSFCFTASTFVFGTLTARYQAYEVSSFYDVVTKSGAFTNVRIVRASSSGFLITHEHIILFVPSGEVRYVRQAISDERTLH
jgi:hypothetical protein